MRNVYQLLREKELQIARVRQEIEALRATIPLLADETDEPDPVTEPYPPLHVVNRD
jgi:hypothetical protein